MSLCKVMHTIETSEPGGAETILVQIADGLRNEYDPQGLLLTEGWTSSELKVRGIPVYLNQLRRSFDLGWVQRTVRLIREKNIKLLHSHEFTSNSYALLAARVAGVPVICTAHGKNYYPDQFYRRQAYRLVARYSNKFVAVSEDLKSFLVDRIGISENKIVVVHNGIDTEKFKGSNFNRVEIRRDMGLMPQDYVIVVVAALFEMKGHKDLLKSISKLGDIQQKLKVLFIGDGPYKKQLVRLTRKLGLENKIVFTGFRDDIAELLSASDLFVLPSYSEGLPISVLEAMSVGLPVIATDVGGMREIITDGETGYLVPAKDVDALAMTIRWCIENKNTIDEISSAGSAYVRAKFSMENMLVNYRRIYCELLNCIDS